MLRPPAPVIRSSPFDVGALLNACIIIIIITSYVHDGGQNTLFLQLFVNRDIF